MRARMEKAGKKPEFADTKVRHERTTVAALNERIWKELGAEKSLRSFYAGVLGAHHQGKDGKGGSKHTKNSSFWNGLQAELEETMRHLFLKTEVVFFPPVEKPQKGPAMGQGHHKWRKRLPSTLTEPLRPFPAVSIKHLPQRHVTGVFNGVFVLCHQIRIASHAFDRNFYFSHKAPPYIVRTRHRFL